ncbi:MAG: ribosome maturation factor [Hydrotalea flava]|uniref:ribosome maturation factor n=1 Tax=Hydrotalea TaxID=1004300 RepID=UPI00169EE593|nr:MULTISPECIES: ribosome maturation factor [Hydrotalea]MBY0348576.1 ribosome maturation factor [Hydrotalea flava]NIM36285.1 ribosome maturation factor [Hydrotalea flava]NIM39136.1 ribosome maturation factor [Hydrotalea flava]NIN04371.1 ribosome maturation factor [Hydrotalea flava]NIN15997.1 ribosome maturation factor [Hydrotalea flava]
MSTQTHIEQITGIVNSMLETEPSFFCVAVKVKPTQNIKVFLDGDEGLPIEKCVYFNRKLYQLITEAGIFPEGEFSLEVSSPGVGEPLKLHRQYVKNIGRNVEVVFTDDTIKQGVLLAVAEQDILLEHTTGKGKKAITQQILIPFTTIKTTTVQIKF